MKKACYIERLRKSMCFTAIRGKISLMIATHSKTSRIVLIVWLSVIFWPCLLVYAKSEIGHGADIAYVLTGDSRNSSDPDIRDAVKAAQFAIDGNGTISEKDSYDDLVSRLKARKPDLILPEYTIGNFPSLGGQYHRRWCHQGYYYDYASSTKSIYAETERGENGETKYDRRWKLGRDKLLEPALAAIYGFDLSNKSDKTKVEILAIIIYYTHLAGDLTDKTIADLEYQNGPSLIRQMNKDLNQVTPRWSSEYPRFSIDEGSPSDDCELIKEHIYIGTQQVTTQILSGKRPKISIFEKVKNLLGV